MLSTNKKILGSLAAVVMAIGMAAPASAKQFKPGMNPYKPLPGNKIQQPMPKPLPVNKHGHKHHGRNVAIGLAAATAAAIAANASSSCRRWERQCDDGSRRACRKYEANCE